MENKELSIDLFISERKWVQLLLRMGLGLAIALMTLGLSINLVTGNIKTLSIKLFDLLNPQLFIGNRLIGFGILILAMTPALRVGLLLVLWSQEKDWKFVRIAISVLLTLILSMVLEPLLQGR